MFNELPGWNFPLTGNAAAGVLCPKCGHNRANIYDSRPALGGAVVRRRKCRKCRTRFKTYELPAEDFERFEALERFRDSLERFAGDELEAVARLLSELASERSKSDGI